MGKHGYNLYFGEDCVEWFVKDMLYIETIQKQNSEKKIESKPQTKT